MLPAERHRRIVGEASRVGTVSTERLAALLGVSAETIRRDLAHLERRGALTRVHGGATATTALVGEGPLLAEGGGQRSDAEAAIGRAAAALVRPGQTIVIETGTTAVEVARALPQDHRGVVATPSLLVAAELATRPGIDVLVCGGRVRPDGLVCSNHLAVSFFADLRADLAFLAAGGVDARAGLTDGNFDEIATKRTIMEGSSRTYVLADVTKHGRIAAHRVCGLDAVTGMITDEMPDTPLAYAMERAGGAVITA